MSAADQSEQQEVAVTAGTSVEKRARKRRWRQGGLALLAIVLVASTISWLNRDAIATGQIDAQLEKLGLEARYDLEAIGTRSQILNNIVIGDPQRPDLTVDRVEVVLSPTLTGSIIDRIILDRPVVYGSYDDGELSFGALDQLIFGDSDIRFEFPDFALEIRDGRGLIESDLGDVGLSYDSDGHLRGGFKAQIAASSPKIAAVGCSASETTFQGVLSIDAEIPRLQGPLKIASARCDNGAQIGATQIALDGSTDRLLADFDAKLKLDTVVAAMAGARLENIAGSSDLSWKDGLLVAEYDLTGKRFIADQISLASLGFAGDFRALDGFERIEARASLTGEDVRPGSALDRELAAYVQSSEGTLVAPLLTKLRTALRRELPGSELTADILWRDGLEGMSLLIPQAQLHKSDGAPLIDSSRLQVAFRGSFAPRISGNFVTGGADLPQAMGRFDLRDGNTLLDFAMREYRSGGSAVALPDMELVLARDGSIRFAGQARATGPIPDGEIANLSAPVIGRLSAGGALSIWSDCTNFTFDRLQYSDLALANRRLRICPGAGGAIVQSDAQGVRVAARMPQAALAGSYGNETFALNSADLSLSYNSASGEFAGSASGLRASGRYAGQTFAIDSPRASIDAAGNVRAPNSGLTLGRGSSAARISWADLSAVLAEGGAATIRDVEVEVGRGSSLTRMTFAEVDAQLGDTITGQFADADVIITPVPLDIFDAAGEFTFAGGILNVFNGTFRLEDRAEADRFKPVFGRTASLMWDGDRLEARAPMYAPKSKLPVLSASVVHSIASGFGFADLQVDGLTFDEDLQPDDLTELTLGVVANVDGAISGTGRVDWTPDGDVTSSGRFATAQLDLAAPFGPAKGLAGEIVFTDLLNFTTPPDQKIAVQSINPGIEVFDGVLDYRIENGELLMLQEGTWPFLGGTLTLKPSRFGFSRTERREFTMIIEGAEAAQFIQQMELGNISATGTFDGELPLVFEGVDGRIVGGTLTAREPGGNLSYVGELTYEDMGAIANFAFRSLRSLDFERMSLQIDGPLTGDLITKIQFEGVSQGQGANQNFVTRQIAKLPIEFNVNIKAPFYKLLTSLRSLYDPSFVRDPRDVGLVADDRGLPPREAETLQETVEKLEGTSSK